MGQTYSSIDPYLQRRNTGALAMSELQGRLSYMLSNTGVTSGLGYDSTGLYKAKTSPRDSTPTAQFSRYATDMTLGPMLANEKRILKDDTFLKSAMTRDAEQAELYRAAHRV